MGLISRIYNFTAGAPAVADQVDAEFDQIHTAINGGLDSANLSAALQQALVPAGTLLATARATAPSGYLFCDGSAVSRTTYAALFSAIGTGYGAGDGSTTFNLPDLRGRVPVGVDGTAGRLSANDALGNAAGEQNHTLATSELPSHTHDIHEQFGAAGGISGLTFLNQGGNQFDGYVATEPAGGGGGHNNMQPYQIVNYMVKT